MSYNIEQLCKISGFAPEFENLEQLSNDLDKNIKIVSVLNDFKRVDKPELELADDSLEEDIPVKFEDVEKLRAQFPDRDGNELKVQKVL